MCSKVFFCCRLPLLHRLPVYLRSFSINVLSSIHKAARHHPSDCSSPDLIFEHHACAEDMSEHPDRGPDSSLSALISRTGGATQPALQGPSGLLAHPGLRHLGTSQVRARTGDRLTETINDYLDIFQELQIDPTLHTVFWSGVIYRYRQGAGHASLLKRGTEASIRNMSDDILRAYGSRIWGEKSEWRSGPAQQEEELVFDKNGPNTRQGTCPR